MRNRNEKQGFWAKFLHGILHELVSIVLHFAIGTGASAAICLYYGLPLALSILGGIVVLGISLALRSQSIFDL